MGDIGGKKDKAKSAKQAKVKKNKKKEIIREYFIKGQNNRSREVALP